LIASRPAGALARALGEAGVDPHGIAIIEKKAETVVLRVDLVAAPVANIIKQQLLSLGGDAAVHREVITGGPPQSSVYIIADRSRLARLPAKLARQPFGLAELGSGIERLLAAAERSPRAVPFPADPSISRRAPSSWASSTSRRTVSRTAAPGSTRRRARTSPRDGRRGRGHHRHRRRIDAPRRRRRERGDGARARHAGPAQARRRRERSYLDRYEARFRRAGGRGRGASIVNDVSGLGGDAAMIDAVRKARAAVVIMHMRGTPETMQNDPRYGERDRRDHHVARRACGGARALGIDREKIIVDPGVGFGKDWTTT